MAFSTKNLLKSCWKIEPRSIPSNIAPRHVFFLKSVFTRGKIFIAQYCQQSYSMILRGTLHTDRILRQESFCKKLNRVKPALLTIGFLMIQRYIDYVKLRVGWLNVLKFQEPVCANSLNPITRYNQPSYVKHTTTFKELTYNCFNVLITSNLLKLFRYYKSYSCYSTRT